MMQDPFTAKIVSRDARDFARNRKIKTQANKEETSMAMTEETIEKIRKDFDKHNEQVLKIYRRNGDKALLELLYLSSDDPEDVAKDFGISLEDAANLVEKDKASKADPIGTIENASNALSVGLAAILGKLKKPAEELLQHPQENSDITNENDYKESADENESDDTEENESSDDDSADDTDDDIDLVDLLKNPEKIIEGLCFLGEVIQDTSEKICDVLDESVERVMEHDFDD